MKYVELGSTGLQVSAIGLGTWAMGGRWWGPTDDLQAERTIFEALELGINLIDTADVYGFGHSETLLGDVLRDRRQEVVLAGKVGLRWNNKNKVRHDLSPAHIFQALDASLSRLQTDYLDIYQVHWPDPDTPIEATAGALARCVESGKVRFLGLSNFSCPQIEEFQRYGRYHVCQPPLNLFERYAEVAILPFCFKKKLGVLTYSPLCRGLLSGTFKRGAAIKESVRRRDPLFNGKTLERNLAIVGHLSEAAAELDLTVSQLAIAWVLAHSGVHTALCGARKPGHLKENCRAAEVHIEHDLLRRIDTIMVTGDSGC